MKHPNSLSLRRRVALELWRKRMDIAVKEHPLRQLFWECTQRCNLHCRHCGSDCRAEVGVADMPLADFTRVLDSVALRTDPNRVFVVVTGGEPLMRHDIAECGAAIYERGFPWGMVTNTLALTPLKFQSLLDAGIHSMTVSLDGIGDDHNWMPAEYRGILDFIKQTRKEGAIHTNYGCEGFMGDYEGDIRDYFFGCQAGITTGSVLADGSVSACASIRSDYHQGNIYEDDFMDVWEHRYHPYRDREWMRREECSECKFFRYCRGGAMHLRDSDGSMLMCPLHRLG